MTDIVLTILPSVISAISVALITVLSKRLTAMVRESRDDWKVMKESQRNQLKSQIVVRFERAQERGYITTWDLESMHRMAESYYKLDGNSYIHTVMDRVDRLPIKEDAYDIR